MKRIFFLFHIFKNKIDQFYRLISLLIRMENLEKNWKRFKKKKKKRKYWNIPK